MARRNPKVKMPIDAFEKCPGCLTSVVSSCGIHVFCQHCGWDSIQAYVDAGGYDTFDPDTRFNSCSQR